MRGGHKSCKGNSIYFVPNLQVRVGGEREEVRGHQPEVRQPRDGERAGGAGDQSQHGSGSRDRVLPSDWLQRAEEEERKILELEDELRIVGSNLQQLEVSEEKALAREETYQKQIDDLIHRSLSRRVSDV